MSGLYTSLVILCLMTGGGFIGHGYDINQDSWVIGGGFLMFIGTVGAFIGYMKDRR